ncbi:MAG TPA: DUF885 family protein, partial [Halioglobus sp.]
MTTTGPGYGIIIPKRWRRWNLSTNSLTLSRHEIEDIPVRLFLIITMLLAGPAWSKTPYQNVLEQIAKSRESDSARLERLFKTSWEYTMTTFPEWATYVGYPGQNTRWTDNSLSAIELRKAEAKDTLRAINSIGREKLGGEQQISYDLFRKEAEIKVEGAQFPQELLALNQLWGVQSEIVDQMLTAPEASVQDYRDRLARLRAAPKMIADTQNLLAEGVKRGVTQPAIALEKVPDQIVALTPDNPEVSPIYAPFAYMKADLPAVERTEIQQEAK